MTTITNPPSTSIVPELPAELVRTRAPAGAQANKVAASAISAIRKAKTATPQVPAMPGTSPLGLKAPSDRELDEVARGKKVKLTKDGPKTKKGAAKQAKPNSPVARDLLKGATTKVVPSPKTAPKAPPRRPTEIARTEGNPQKSIVPMRFKAHYHEHHDSNGDRVAEALRTFTHVRNDDGRPSVSIENLRKVCADNGIDFGRYEGLNNGQKRMNVGNRLRGLLKAGKTVVIGTAKFTEKALAKKPVTA